MAEVRSVLKLLREQQGARLSLGGGDDQAVPPIELEATLDLVGARKYLGVDFLGVPLEQFEHIIPSGFASDPVFRPLSKHGVILIENLNARSPAEVPPEHFEPLPCTCALDGILRFARVYQDGGVNEYERGHRFPGGWGAVRRTRGVLSVASKGSAPSRADSSLDLSSAAAIARRRIGKRSCSAQRP